MTRRNPVMQFAAVAATLLCFIQPSCTFTSTPQLSTQHGTHSTELPMIKRDADTNFSEDVSDRRQFFAKVAATAAAPILLNAEQASAVSDEPTRIELVVDTEYLIRVLDYFDGDMRKVLSALVRSPQTTVEIDPPATGKDPKLSPEDAILRALYSYNAPEDYATQASWLKIDAPKKGLISKSIDFLTKKRYTIYLPQASSTGVVEDGWVKSVEGAKPYEKLEVSIRPTNLNLSNLEVAAGLGVLSYPLAYSYYNYESFKEEEQAKLKKAQMAAKRAAKAKAKAAAKKSKGTPKKEAAEKKTAVQKKGPPAVKGQEAKKKAGDEAAPTKKAKKEKIEKPTVEDKVAAEMLDSKREKFVESAEKKVATDNIAAEMLDSKRENFIAASTEQETTSAETKTDGYANAAAAQGGSYLDNLSGSDKGSKSLAENAKPKQGPSGYLDSL